MNQHAQLEGGSVLKENGKCKENEHPSIIPWRVPSSAHNFRLDS